jgi:hypothetical protein
VIGGAVFWVGTVGGLVLLVRAIRADLDPGGQAYQRIAVGPPIVRAVSMSGPSPLPVTVDWAGGPSSLSSQPAPSAPPAAPAGVGAWLAVTAVGAIAGVALSLPLISFLR